MHKLEKHHIIPLSLLGSDDGIMELKDNIHKHVHKVLDLSYDDFNNLIERYDSSRNNSLIEKPNDVELRYLMWKEYISNIDKLNNSSLVLSHVLHLKKLLMWDIWSWNKQFLLENWFNWRIKNSKKSTEKLQWLWLNLIERLNKKDLEVSKEAMNVIKENNSKLSWIINRPVIIPDIWRDLLLPTKLLWNSSIQNNWLFIPESKSVKTWPFVRQTRVITNWSKIYSPEILNNTSKIQLEYLREFNLSDRSVVYSVLTVLAMMATEEAFKVWITINPSQLASDSIDMWYTKWLEFIINQITNYRSMLSQEIIDTIWNSNSELLSKLNIPKNQVRENIA